MPDAPVAGVASGVPEYLLMAAAAGLAASILCGIVGPFVVLKRWVSLGGGIAHAAFGGLGFAHWSGLEPRLGALAVASLSAVALGSRRGHGERDDPAIGALWAIGMAVGLLFLHWTPGYAPNLLAFLFGDLLFVSRLDLAWASVAAIALSIAFLALRRTVTAVAFDEDQARLDGWPTRAVKTAMLLAIALVVVVLLRLVGLALAIALLTLPALTGLRLCRGLTGIVTIAMLSAVVANLGGLWLACQWDLPVGATIVVAASALWGAAQVWPGRRVRAEEPS